MTAKLGKKNYNKQQQFPRKQWTIRALKGQEYDDALNAYWRLPPPFAVFEGWADRLIAAWDLANSARNYFVLPPSVLSFTLAAACAAARRAVSTRNGEQET